MRSNTQSPKFFLGIFGVCSLVIFTNLQFLTSRYPTRDSLYYHFNSFEYMAKVLKESGSLPSIFPAEGGVHIQYSLMNFGLSSLHKLVGFAIYLITNQAYLSWKLSILFGLVAYSTGIFLVGYLHTKSILISVSVATLASLIGIGNAFHQEQVLYTATLIPYLYILLYKCLSQPSKTSFTLLFSFLGILSFTHFPQIQIVILLLLVFVLLPLTDLRAISSNLGSYFSFSLIAVLSTSIFAISFFRARTNIVYPHRIAESYTNVSQDLILDKNIFEPLNSSGRKICGPFIQCVENIFFAPQKSDDVISLNSGPVFLVLLVLFAVYQRRILIAIVISSLLFYGPVLNPFGFLALMLENPFGEFRQWYHFFPLVHFFCFLGTFLVFQSVSESSKNKTLLINKFLTAIIIVSCFTSFSIKLSNYPYLTREKEPSNLTGSDEYFSHLRNPHLINFREFYKVCRPSYIRIEPDVYPAVQPVGLLSKSVVDEKPCIDLKKTENFVSAFALDLNYKVDSLSPSISPIGVENYAQLDPSLGLANNFTVLPGGRIHISGWVASMSPRILVSFQIDGETFRCTLNRSFTSMIVNEFFKFDCIYLPLPGRVYVNSDFSLFVNVDSVNYQLVECCDGTLFKKFTFLPIRRNKFFTDISFDTKSVDKAYSFFTPLFNLESWKTSKLVDQSKIRIPKSQNEIISIDNTEMIEIKQISTLKFNVYLYFLYLIQICGLGYCFQLIKRRNSLKLFDHDRVI